jgi:hypothetical protein
MMTDHSAQQLCPIIQAATSAAAAAKRCRSGRPRRPRNPVVSRICDMGASRWVERNVAPTKVRTSEERARQSDRPRNRLKAQEQPDLVD